MRKYFFWISALSSALLFAFIFSAYQLAEIVIFPLDDPFIHLQYARNLAKGLFFRYNPEDPYTAGSTSFIFPFLLVPGFWLGIKDLDMVYYSLALHIFFFFLSLGLWGKIGYKLFEMLKNDGDAIYPSMVAISNMLLFATSGSLYWCFLCGMESSLFIAAISALIYSLLDSGKSRWQIIFWLVILAMVRPEGNAIALLVFIFLFIYDFKTEYFMAIPAIFISPAINLIFAGQIYPNARLIKALTFSKNLLKKDIQTYFSVLKDYIVIFGYQGGKFLKFVPPLSGILFLFFLILLFKNAIKKNGWNKNLIQLKEFKIAFLFLIITGAGTLILAFSGEHIWLGSCRYQMPIMMILMMVIPAFLAILARNMKPSALAYLVMVSAFILSNVFALPEWIRAYAESCENIAHQQLVIARFIREEIEPEAKIAINDAGLIRYIGDHYVVDLLGLVTLEAAKAYIKGGDAVFKRLISLPPQDRPRYFAIYPEWFISPLEVGIKTEVVVVARLKKNRICGGGSMFLFKVTYPDEIFD